MSLHQIASVPTAANSVIRLHVSDNVGVARVTLPPGQQISVGELRIETVDRIPAGHKVALTAIASSGPVIRYGTIIGHTNSAVRPGQHLHTHNVEPETVVQQFRFPDHEAAIPDPPADCPTFGGFVREDGRAGTRNYIAVVAASNCAAYAAELVGRSYDGFGFPGSVDGVVAFPFGDGCAQQIGPDTAQLRRTIAGMMDHPNVSAAVILGLGCEVNQISNYIGDNAVNSRVVGMTLQDVGGTRATVEAARRFIATMIERAAEEKRSPAPVSKLVLGLQCGGSDAFSGVTSNPALGNCCDRLVEVGGAAVLAETTETFGAEHLLVSKARNREVAERYLRLVEQYKAYLRPYGSTFEDNPSPGNKEGGLTNILEKSLGAVAKGGTTTLMDAIDYAERVAGRGFLFMNTPGYDPVSLTGLAAGGCNIMAFTTSRGSTTGFPITPVIKISSNSATYRRMPEDMDVNAGRIADGQASVEDVGLEIYELMLRVAAGARTFSEGLGHNEFVPWRIGPVL